MPWRLSHGGKGRPRDRAYTAKMLARLRLAYGRDTIAVNRRLDVGNREKHCTTNSTEADDAR